MEWTVWIIEAVSPWLVLCNRGGDCFGSVSALCQRLALAERHKEAILFGAWLPENTGRFYEPG